MGGSYALPPKPQTSLRYGEVLPSYAVSSRWGGGEGGGGGSPSGRRGRHFMERGRRPRKRRDPEPRGVVDFTGGPVADLTLRSTPYSKQRTPDWRWPSINLSIPSNNQRRPHKRRDPQPRRDRQTGNEKNARGTTIRRKKGVLCSWLPESTTPIANSNHSVSTDNGRESNLLGNVPVSCELPISKRFGR